MMSADIFITVKVTQDATKAVFEAMEKHGVNTADVHQIVLMLAGMLGTLVGAAVHPEYRDEALDEVMEKIQEGIELQDQLFALRKRQ